MKKNYLAVINKSAFVDLFKYGQIMLHQGTAFDGSLDADDKKLFDKITKDIKAWEYSYEYIIIHFFEEEDKVFSHAFVLNIEDIQRIYAFTEEAQRQLRISLDPRIKIDLAPWTKYFDEFQQRLFKEQCMRGIDNVWKIFNLTDEDKDVCKELIPTKDLEEVVRELFTDERPNGNISIWVYLLRYERHSLYEKNKMRGFFMDFIHVYCNYYSGEEQVGEVAEKTNAGKAIQSSKKIADDFLLLTEIIKKTELHKQIQEMFPKCDLTIAAPLFLYFKSLFIDGLNLHKVEYDFVDSRKNSLKLNFSIASYLLGFTLGYDKTYDEYYDVINLPIFGKKVESLQLTTIESPAMKNKSKNEEIRLEKETSVAKDPISEMVKPADRANNSTVIANDGAIIGTDAKKVRSSDKKQETQGELFEDESVKPEQRNKQTSSNSEYPMTLTKGKKGTPKYEEVVANTPEDKKRLNNEGYKKKREKLNSLED